MRVKVLHNPKAGNEKFPAEEVVKALDEAGYEAEYISVKGKRFKKMLEDAGDLVIAAGGDGTVCKVAKRLVGKNVPLGILPIGTANNISKSLGISGMPHELIALWPSAQVRRIDLGIANGPWGRKQFVESVGVGLFADVMTWLEAKSSRFDDPERKLARDRDALEAAIHDYEAQELSVRIDGQEESGRYLLIEALNMPCLGPNLCLAPDADPGDGALDVVFIPESERDDLARFLKEAENGQNHRPNFFTRRGRHVEFFLNGGRIHIDDKVWPRSKKAEARPRHLGRISVGLNHAALPFLVGK